MNKCYICLSNPPNAGFDCSDAGICSDCAYSIVNEGVGCPICKKPVVSYNVYFSLDPVQEGEQVDDQGYDSDRYEYIGVNNGAPRPEYIPTKEEVARRVQQNREIFEKCLAACEGRIFHGMLKGAEN